MVIRALWTARVALNEDASESSTRDASRALKLLTRKRGHVQRVSGDHARSRDFFLSSAVSPTEHHRLTATLRRLPCTRPVSCSSSLLRTMSKNPKQPMSGLRSIKRDFSSSSLPPPTSQESLASDADTVPWQPTPPPKKLSGLEQRLKDIQDALNAQVASSESVLAASSSSASASSTSASTVPAKRPAQGGSQAPPGKRRQLPAAWTRAAESAAGSSKSGTGARGRQVGETLVVPAAKGGAAKAKPVFLSEEQTHILKLVEAGQSLFYTGSAGECALSVRDAEAACGFKRKSGGMCERGRERSGCGVLVRRYMRIPPSAAYGGSVCSRIH